MAYSQIPARSSESVYLSNLSQANSKDIKLKLGLAELIFQALILILLV